MKIGKRLKQLRKEKSLTLGELSKKSKVAVATLSRMEHDMMTGTLQSHMNICKALGVSLADFYREIESESRVVTLIKQKEQHDRFLYGSKTVVELLTTKLMDKKMMPNLLRIKDRGQTHIEENKHGSEKFIYVIDGNLTAEIDGVEYRLDKGDALYFEASLPHILKNRKQKEVVAICILTPPEL